MKILIPGPLRSYTHQASSVDAPGRTIDELLRSLDEQFPGLRFRIIDEHDRIREHIKIFVNTQQCDTLDVPLAARDEIQIICALSGG